MRGTGRMRSRVKFVLHDRDASFTAVFDGVLPAPATRRHRKSGNVGDVNAYYL
jgi:hypothetical protein